MTTAYFGLLRTAEFTVRSHASFSFERNLTLNDVNIINTKPFDYMSLRLKDSKTDKSRKGVFIYIGCTDKDVCAVCAMSFYLLKRKNLTDDPNSLPIPS